MHTAVVYRDRAGQWRFREQAANGEIIATSEAYSRRWSAIRAAKRNTDAVRIHVQDRNGGLARTITR